jgi:hypothetical protein
MELSTKEKNGGNLHHALRAMMQFPSFLFRVILHDQTKKDKFIP